MPAFDPNSSLGEFSHPIRVYIEDTDSGGIVYYVNYLKFMERARTEFMRALGFSKAADSGSGQLMVVHSANIQYKKPARLDDELMVTAKVVERKRSWLLFEQSVFRALPRTGPGEEAPGERELLSLGQIKVACVDAVTMKPQAMPEAMTRALKSISSTEK